MTPLYIHGGRIDLAAVRYPEAPRPWLDLSTGINPLGWRPPTTLNVDLTALPSPAALHDLEAAAASLFGTSPERVVALPGSEIGLRMLDTLRLAGPTSVVVPSYATHSEALDQATPIARSEIDVIPDGTLILANPNNPDGRCDTPERLLGIARRGVWLIVDEAFADTMPTLSIVPHLQPEDQVIVFRSFGKFFGLAGVRLGFMIGPAAQVATIRRRLGSWPLSAHAVVYGTAAYRDTGWVAKTRADIADRAARLDAVLARHGLRGEGACPLFRLVQVDDAMTLFEKLARAGILTRPFDYAPRWLRIGVPADERAFDRLEGALGHG